MTVSNRDASAMTDNCTDNRQIKDIWAVSIAGNTRTEERNTPKDDKDGRRAQNLNGTSHVMGQGIIIDQLQCPTSKLP